MSKESWLAEFYPIAASTVTLKDAVGHSLQKWKGLTEESLAKHGIDVPPIIADGDTCALCARYAKGSSATACRKCPVMLYNGVNCNGDDYTGESVTSDTPYLRWRSGSLNKDPQPMIDLLQLLKDKEDGKDQGSASSP